MQITKPYTKGNVSISLNAIAAIAGNAACECYGVLGLASKHPLKDELNELLGTEDYVKGVDVKELKDGIAIDVYVVVSYGIKITEIASEVQKKVRYVLKRALDLNFSAVNVYVQSVSVLA